MPRHGALCALTAPMFVYQRKPVWCERREPKHKDSLPPQLAFGEPHQIIFLDLFNVVLSSLSLSRALMSFLFGIILCVPECSNCWHFKKLTSLLLLVCLKAICRYDALCLLSFLISQNYYVLNIRRVTAKRVAKNYGRNKIWPLCEFRCIVVVPSVCRVRVCESIKLRPLL